MGFMQLTIEDYNMMCTGFEPVLSYDHAGYGIAIHPISPEYTLIANTARQDEEMIDKYILTYTTSREAALNMMSNRRATLAVETEQLLKENGITRATLEATRPGGRGTPESDSG